MGISSSDGTPRMSLWGFYKECGRRAVKGKFERARAWQAGVTVLIGVAASLAATLLPGGLPIPTWALAVLGWAPFVMIFGVGIARDAIRSPYQMCVEQALRAADAEGALASAAEPALAFVDPGDLGTSTPPRLPTSKLHRIALYNPSPTTALANVEVTLVSWRDLTTGEKKHIGQRLIDERGEEEGLLKPHATKRYDLMLVRPDKNPPSIRFAPSQDLRSPHGAPFGKYGLDIEATSATAPPLKAKYILETNSNGTALTLMSRWPEKTPTDA